MTTTRYCLIYCPSYDTLFAGNMGTFALKKAVKVYVNNERMPRGYEILSALQAHERFGPNRWVKLLDDNGEFVAKDTLSNLYPVPDDAPAPEPDAPEPEKAKEPEPEKVEVKERPSVGAAIEEAILDAMAMVAEESVNEDRVRDIALEVAREIALGEPQRVEVTVKRPDLPDVTIDNAHKALARVMEVMQTGPVLLVGPTGCGKTTLAEQLAKALDVPFYYNGAVASEHKLMGYKDAAGNYHESAFSKAYTEDCVYLFDEIDASNPNALLAFNASIANGYGDFPCAPEPLERHENLRILASANTWGHGADRQYVGRNQLDAATLDRFIPIPMDYDPALETALAGPLTEWRDKVWRVRKAAADHDVRHVVSTRAIVRGRILLENGMSRDDVTDLVLRRGLKEDSWRKINV